MQSFRLYRTKAHATTQRTLMNDEQKPPQPAASEQSSGSSEGESLESTQESSSPAQQEAAPAPLKKSPKEKISGLIKRLNIYLLLFILVVLIAGMIAFVAYSSSRDEQNQVVIEGQELTQEELEALANSNTEIGDSKSTVTVASNAVFNGRVLVRDSLDVAGTIRVGGALSLPGITVSGTSNFDNAQVASNLGVAGNFSTQGDATVGGVLTVTRSASFGGPISAPALNIETLVLNNDITLNRHIATGGGTQVLVVVVQSAEAGLFSIGGSDIAGTVTINTGGGPSAAYLRISNS